MLSKFKQIAVQLEAQEGVHEAGEVAGDLLTIKNLKWKPDFERYADTVQLTLTPTPGRKSRLSGTLEFEVELAGAAAGQTTTAPFAALMRAAGFRMRGETTIATTPYGGSANKGRVFYVNAEQTWTTGTQLDHGTVVTDGATGDAIVIGTYVSGVAQRIYLLNTDAAGADFASAGVITATGIAIDYAGAPVQASRIFHPTDKPTYYLRGTLAGTIPAGSIVTGGTSGAKALVIASFASGAQLLVERAPGFGFFATGETVYKDTGVNEIATIAAPVQYDIPTLSITYYEDGNRVRLAGCRGSAVITWDNGKPGLMKVTMVGLHDSETSTAMFPPAAPLEQTPPTFLGATFFTIDQVLHPLISKFEVDLGRVTPRRSDVEKPNGYGFTASVDRKIVGKLDPEAVQEAIFPFIGKSKDAVLIRIDSIYGTGVTGNQFHMMAPAVQYIAEPNEREGQSTFDMNLEFYGKAGVRGDEFVLATI